jgi:hypothetical protein
MHTIKILTSDEMRGRLPGDTGYNLAAEYISNEFRDARLKPVANQSYFQCFNIESNVFTNEATFEIIDKSSITIKYELGKDFSCRGFSGSGEFRNLKVVFCGYGISDSVSGYSDYTGIDVEGKAVLIFKQNPAFKNKRISKDFGIRQKAQFAYDNGAKVVLFVSTPNSTNPQRPIGSVMHGEGAQHTDLPQLHLDISLADKLLEGSAYKLNLLQSIIDSTESPKNLILNSLVDVNVQAKYIPDARTMNVVCMIEGNDPTLKNEYIVLGAHLDHVGKQGEIIYPGANDNASGSAVVIEIARKTQKLKVKPKRSIIFVLFACEEQGIQGSTWFVEHSPVPISNIKAMLNFDCVGHGDSIQIGSGKSFPELWKLINDIDNEHSEMMINDTWQGGGADAQPFFEKGIPTAYFVSKNSYTHLHLPSDKLSTLNPDLLKEIANLGYLTALKLADLPQIDFNK